MTPLAIFLRALKAIATAASSDVKKLPVDTDTYYAALPVLVETYGMASGLAASDFYNTMRLDAGLDDVFEALIPEPDSLGIPELVGWAGDTATSPEAFSSLVSGGVQRRIANYARQTVSESSYKDSMSRGWMRIGTPDCEFCAVLISRGAVYTERTAVFASHDNCDCQAVPIFNPNQIRHVNTEFVASARKRTDAKSKGIDGNYSNENKETRKEMAERYLPGLRAQLKKLLAEGRSEDSPSVRYHRGQIRKFESYLR